MGNLVSICLLKIRLRNSSRSSRIRQRNSSLSVKRGLRNSSRASLYNNNQSYQERWRNSSPSASKNKTAKLVAVFKTSYSKHSPSGGLDRRVNLRNSPLVRLIYVFPPPGEIIAQARGNSSSGLSRKYFPPGSIVPL